MRGSGGATGWGVFLMVALLVAALAASPAALAAERSKLDEVLARGYLIVGTGSTNPPWHFENEKGELVGFDIDMARLVAKGLFDDPNKVQFVRQKADARVPNLLSGKVDIVFQFMTVNAQRAQLVEFTVPYYREAVTGLLRADAPYKSVLEMRGKRVKASILQNVYAEDFVHRAIPDAEVLQFDSQANVILALDSRRVEVAMIDLSTAQWYVRQNPGKYKVSTYSWLPQTYAAAVRPGDSRWLNFVNTVLREAMMGVEFDAYAQAFEQWFGEKLPPPQAGFPVEFR